MKTLMLATAVAVIVLAGRVAAAGATEWKTLRIGVEGAYPPFSDVTADGTLTGFNIDIADALCTTMTVECQFIVQDWGGIISALLARKFDALVASITITEERRKRVAFTRKYYQSPEKFVARAGSDLVISTDGLKGKVIGVQRGTIHDTYITDNFEGVATVRRYRTQDEAYANLIAGRVDALLADAAAIKHGFLDTETGQGYAYVGPDLTDAAWFGDGAGIAVRKQDTDLRDRLNTAIATILANGTYKKIQDKYFDFNIYGGPYPGM